MTEPKLKQARHYVVLAKLPAAEGDAVCSDQFQKLGTVEANEAESACVAAMQAHGLPTGTTVAVAVPVTNWNACKVTEETQPRFEAKRMSAMPEEKPRNQNLTGAAEPGT